MSLDPTRHYEYQAGGSLPTDAPTYIARQADQTLYEAILQHEYCSVLNARQMGKSSLRIRTMIRLMKQGIACTEIELSGIGSQEITAVQWYGGLMQEMASGLGLRFRARQWLKEREHLSPVQALREFIDTIVLEQIEGAIAIFIDEIDSILSLKFSTDEFFSLIRNLYDRRATNPEYRRLSFVFLGVATPAELIQEKGRSAPFNIGTAIDLQGFQLKDCAPLMTGLAALDVEPAAAMQSILDWTGGQPFLTQKVCALLVQQETEEPEATPKQATVAEVGQLIPAVIQSRILKSWESQDEPEHLRTIRDRLLRNARNTSRLLRLYATILQRGSIPYRSASQDHLALRLSGLVEPRQGRLRVKNRIYQQVFSPEWVAEQLGDERPVESWPAVGVSDRRLKPRLGKLILAGALATCAAMGLRSVGSLHRWELQAYDQLMQLRPDEGPDARLFLIQVTETDVQAQPADERGGVSLSDPMLNQLLAKLEQAQPRTIGFDLYREQAAKEPALSQRLASGGSYFICQYGQPGVPSSPDLPPGFAGFNNTPLDRDETVRRHLLSVDEADALPCQSNLAFSLRLVERYLYDEQRPLAVTESGLLSLGSVVLPLLPEVRAYPRRERGGYQLLLNYRATQTTPEAACCAIADTASLGDVLSESFDLERLRDRLVLVGTVAPSFNDHRWSVPHRPQPMTGVEIQAHMVSQLLSAVLDRRPLIQLWPRWGDWLWVASWAMLAVLLLSCARGLVIRMAIATGLVGLLVAFSLVLLLQGWWVPLVPAIVAGIFAPLLGTGLTRKLLPTASSPLK